MVEAVFEDNNGERAKDIAVAAAQQMLDGEVSVDDVSTTVEMKKVQYYLATELHSFEHCPKCKSHLGKKMMSPEGQHCHKCNMHCSFYSGVLAMHPHKEGISNIPQLAVACRLVWYQLGMPKSGDRLPLVYVNRLNGKSLNADRAETPEEAKAKNLKLDKEHYVSAIIENPFIQHILSFFFDCDVFVDIRRQLQRHKNKQHAIMSYFTRT